jgi:hypothetical protein
MEAEMEREEWLEEKGREEGRRKGRKTMNSGAGIDPTRPNASLNVEE